MIKNNIILAWRKLWKNKLQSVILIVGLAVGLAATYFIGHYVHFEQSYDRFHTKSDRIFRLPITYFRDGVQEGKDALTAAPIGPMMKKEFPEVEEYVRFTSVYGRTVFEHENQRFEEEQVYYVDSTLFQIFDFSLLEGDAESCLKRPFTVVLTKSSAELYFGKWTESPIGQSIRMNNQYDFEVTGIVADAPQNSHIKFDAFLSFPTFYTTTADPSNDWRWHDFWTYILLSEDADQEQVVAKLPAFNERHHYYKDKNFYQETFLQALTDIHLKSKLGYEFEANGDKDTVISLFLVGLAILIIAFANYINLATAKGEDQLQEMGVRKVIGANRRLLNMQLLSEAFITNLFAILLAVFIVLLSQNSMSNLIGQPINTSAFLKHSWYILPLLLLASTLIAGAYPALYLSSVAPSRILVDTANHKNQSNVLRKGLVIFQYSASILLIVATLIVYAQLNHMKNQDLGFSIDQKLILKAPTAFQDDNAFAEQYQSFKNSLFNLPEIEQIGASGAIPGKNYLDLDYSHHIRLASTGKERNRHFQSTYVDDGFIEAYGLKLLAGRNFSENPAKNKETIILTETAMNQLGITNVEQAIGKSVLFGRDTKQVIGVVEDYHHKSLKHPYEPMLFRYYYPTKFTYLTIGFGEASIANLSGLIDKIEKTWVVNFPNDPFNYFFLDEHFNDQYLAQQQLGNTFFLFSCLTILIACLGLFGLATYITSTRTKEIGIRKVLGASVAGIVALLSKDFIQLVVIAFIIATPIAYYFMNQWLQNFAYHIEIQWWVFALAGIGAIGIALLTVSFQSIKAALANPVESLRNE